MLTDVRPCLAGANGKLCFCDDGIVDTVRAVIGEEGLDFFRAFADRQGLTLVHVKAQLQQLQDTVMS